MNAITLWKMNESMLEQDIKDFDSWMELQKLKKLGAQLTKDYSKESILLSFKGSIPFMK